MNKAFYNWMKLGILGGGQLGRMFIQDAISYNVHTLVLDPDDNAPCSRLCSEFYTGSLTDFDTVYNFGKRCDVLTIEFEHVNVDALFKLEAEGVKVFPQPAVLKIVQDKGLQKQFYKENEIPTAPFVLLNNKNELAAQVNLLPVFQKLRTSGYDGKGVVKLSTVLDFEKAFDEKSVLEKLVDFEKELSVIVARNEQGEVKHFPVVELDFNREANLVEFLISPANIEPNIAQQAIDIARSVVEKLNIVGILAVELFLTKDGQVLVNEIAPRPHNSGHQTIEANITSQYEQHLRAILNLPLGATDIKLPSVMVNLLGEKGYEGEAIYSGLNEVLAIGGVSIHLYGKKNTKPFRKMGHVTVVATTLEQARQKAQIVKEVLRVIA